MLGAAASAPSPLEEWCVLGGAANLGVIASQGAADPTIVQAALGKLGSGAHPRESLGGILDLDEARDHRQVLVLDARGRTAAHSGRGCAPPFGHTEGTDHVAAGHQLGSPHVIGAMSLSFERSGGDPLWERLMLALESGDRADRLASGRQSAALVLYGLPGGRMLDLRVGPEPDPVVALRRALALWRDISSVEGPSREPR